MVRHVEIRISHALSEVEWTVLSVFCDKARRLIATKMVSGDESSIHGKVRYEQEMGLWFEATLPPEEQVAEFLMAFRFFYLQKESTHFPAVLGIIGKHTSQPEAREAMKVFRRKWEHCLFGNAMNICLNDKPITSSLLLDLWFNAHYFHSDVEKGMELTELKKAFSEDFAKFMLLDSAFEASKVVLKIYDSVRGLVDEHFKKTNPTFERGCAKARSPSIPS